MSTAKSDEEQRILSAVAEWTDEEFLLAFGFEREESGE